MARRKCNRFFSFHDFDWIISISWMKLNKTIRFNRFSVVFLMFDLTFSIWWSKPEKKTNSILFSFSFLNPDLTVWIEKVKLNEKWKFNSFFSFFLISTFWFACESLKRMKQRNRIFFSAIKTDSFESREILVKRTRLSCFFFISINFSFLKDQLRGRRENQTLFVCSARIWLVRFNRKIEIEQNIEIRSIFFFFFSIFTQLFRSR